MQSLTPDRSATLQVCWQWTFGTVEPLVISSLRPCQSEGGGGSLVAVWILKHFLSVFINACRLLSALLSLSQFGRGRLFLVAISFYSLSLLFGPCRLSEFTLAGPPPWPLFWPSKMAIHFLIKKPLIANTVTYQYGQQPHFRAPPRGGCMFPRSLNLFGFYPLFPITKTPCSQKWSQQSSQEFPCSLKIIWKYPLFPENKCYSSRVP